MFLTYCNYFYNSLHLFITSSRFLVRIFVSVCMLCLCVCMLCWWDFSLVSHIYSDFILLFCFYLSFSTKWDSFIWNILWFGMYALSMPMNFVFFSLLVLLLFFLLVCRSCDGFGWFCLFFLNEKLPSSLIPALEPFTI